MLCIPLNLKTVTPMFLHGHNNKILELRPPPFKALFRYWWRTVQDCDTDSLRKDEAKLFGSTKGKAPFAIRIPKNKDLQRIQYKPLPHKHDKDKLGLKLDAYKGGQSFDLYLITKNESDSSTYKQIAKLAFLLGGIGNRSRRGFGSIHEIGWKFSDVPDLQKEVLDTLNTFSEKDRFQTNKSFTINNRTLAIIELKPHPPHPHDYPVIRRIFLGKLTNDVNMLLKKIGKATSVAKRTNKDNTLGDGRPRMASPVVVSIQMIGDQYLPVVTQLWSPYPNNRPPHNFQQKQEQFIDTIIGDFHE